MQLAQSLKPGNAKSLQSICKVQKVNWDIVTALFLWFSKEHKVEVCIMKWPYVCKLNPTFVLQMLTFTDQIHSCLWVFADQLRIYTLKMGVFADQIQHSLIERSICTQNVSAHRLISLFVCQTWALINKNHCTHSKQWAFLDQLSVLDQIRRS